MPHRAAPVPVQRRKHPSRLPQAPQTRFPHHTAAKIDPRAIVVFWYSMVAYTASDRNAAYFAGDVDPGAGTPFGGGTPGGGGLENGFRGQAKTPRSGMTD